MPRRFLRQFEKIDTTAIDMRGPADENGVEIYEFNRAICRIKQDKEYNENKPSTPERRQLIMDDIKVARSSYLDPNDNKDIKKWLSLNRAKRGEKKRNRECRRALWGSGAITREGTGSAPPGQSSGGHV